MSSALREDPGLSSLVKRIRRALDDEDFAAARAVLPELRSEIERAELSGSTRRSAERALRELEEGTGLDAYWRQATWKRIAITVTVVRDGRRVMLGPRKTIQVQKRWIWGFVPAEKLVSYPLGRSLSKAVGECWSVVTATGSGFAGIFHAKERSQISGPVGIVR